MYVLKQKEMQEVMSKYSSGEIYGRVLIDLPKDRDHELDEILKLGMEVLIHIHRIQEFNRSLEGLGIKSKVDVEIYHRILETLFDESRPLNDSERQRFFTEQKKLWDFTQNIKYMTSNSYHLPSIIELMAFGLKYSEKLELAKLYIWEDLVDALQLFQLQYEMENIDYEKFSEIVFGYIGAVRNAYHKKKEEEKQMTKTVTD
ncbi:MAG: hypothetical protein AAF575_03530 [Bacteroidota bacterium]